MALEEFKRDFLSKLAESGSEAVGEVAGEGGSQRQGIGGEEIGGKRLQPSLPKDELGKIWFALQLAKYPAYPLTGV